MAYNNVLSAVCVFFSPGPRSLLAAAVVPRPRRAQLLSTLLEYNPYNSTLDLKINQEKSAQAEAELRAMAPAPANTDPAAHNGDEEGGDGDREGSTGGDPSGERRGLLETTLISAVGRCWVAKRVELF